MSEPGTGAKATAAQRAEVERLPAEGVPIRQIAAQVFGDARFRGRVERILRGRDGATPAIATADLAAGERVVAELGTAPTLRMLFERRLALLVAREKPPSMSELRALLDV